MADRAGGTPALGKFYFAMGPIVKLEGAGDLTISVGEASIRAAGKPFSMQEQETFDADLLLAIVAANAIHAAKINGSIYTFAVDDAPNTGVTSVIPLWNGFNLAAHGEIAVPVACEASKIGLTLWHDTTTPPTDWSLKLFKNGVEATTAAVTFGAAEIFSYASLSWAAATTFVAGDRFNIKLGGGIGTADNVRANISAIFLPT